MNPEILAEMKFFLISVLAGASLIVAYDSLRLFRRFVRHSAFWLGAEDLCFWTAAGVFLFLVMERYYDGIVRSFSLLGALLGMLVYQEFLSGIIVGLLECIIRFLLGILRRIVALLLWPVCLTGRGAEKIGEFVAKSLKKCKKILKNTLKNPDKEDKIDNRDLASKKGKRRGRSRKGKAVNAGENQYESDKRQRKKKKKNGA
ncbi:MAG: spore cortex biosynthesis protein YabQ [Lachnospiraceae bacterium]|nr:spore cortex biosynthesis protein YabQ [Lachnospiraceae bacterium]